MGEPNWANKTLFTGDNLPIMRRMNSNSVDLIYLDPPFNSNHNYAAPTGSEAEGAEFSDIWSLADLDEEWIPILRERYRGKNPREDPPLFRAIMAANTDSDKSYLVYMAIRLLEMHRILRDTGSIYLHCDPTMSHYLKVVMDAIFGRKNFRNEIIWCYPPGGKGPRYGFHRKHDVILYYSQKGNFNRPYTEHDEYSRGKFNKIDENGRRYKEYPGGRSYLDESPGRPVPDWWTDIHSLGQTQSRERTGYPTQKPLSLLERIILASTSSDTNPIVFDPFCGCATTLAMADQLERQWIGIDKGAKAAALIKKRIQDQKGLWREIIARSDVPQRTDTGLLAKPSTWLDHLYGIQGGICVRCDDQFPKGNMEVDHIVARSKGGTDHIDNLQLLCGCCSQIKGNGGMEYLRRELLLTEGFQ